MLYANALIAEIRLLCAVDSVDVALRLLPDTKRAAKRSGSQLMQAKASMVEADLATHLGRFDDASEKYAQLITICSKSEYYDLCIMAENQMGYIWRERGQSEQSMKAFLRAVEFERQSDYPELKAMSLNYLGSYYWRNGQYNQALNYYLQALSIRNQCGNNFDIVNSLSL